MSEQLDTLLSEMQNKFEESFSQKNLHDLLNKQLNPESGKKQQQKNNDKNQQLNINEKQTDFHENSQTRQLEHNNDQKQQYHHQKSNTDQNQTYKHQPIKRSQDSQRQSTPNFKQYQRFHDQDNQNLRKTTSQQQFSKMENQKTHSSEQNPFYYKLLTSKLQNALKKISSHKSAASNKSSNDFYDRIEQFEQKKKRQIERKRQQIEEKQINSIKQGPLINSHSRTLVAQMNKDPIYIRTQKILQNKKTKQEQYKKIKLHRQEKQYEQFKDQYQNYMESIRQKYQGKSLRTSDQYYHQMEVWLKNRQKNIEAKITQNNEKQKNANTFKPLINSKSQKILMKKHPQKRIPIQNRELKPKEQTQDPNCTFKPKINKSNFYKKMNFYQSPL